MADRMKRACLYCGVFAVKEKKSKREGNDVWPNYDAYFAVYLTFLLCPVKKTWAAGPVPFQRTQSSLSLSFLSLAGYKKDGPILVK